MKCNCYHHVCAVDRHGTGRPVICLPLMLHAISLELAGHYKAELLCQLLRAGINEPLRHLYGVVHAVQPISVNVFGNPGAHC